MTRNARTVPILILVAVVLAAATLTWLISPLFGLPVSSQDFNLVDWELKYLPSSWMYRLSGLWRDDLSRQEEDATLRGYLALEAEAERLEERFMRAPAGEEGEFERGEVSRLLDAKRDERDSLENDVEAILESRVADEAASLGLERSLPLFSDVRWLFPPVDVEFDSPPRVLVTSPRSEIRLEGSRLLRSDLAVEDVLRIEAEKDDSDTSALIVRSGGIATYPSIMPSMNDYGAALELVAHEWLHQYLFFQPLGMRYYENDALRTINETLADIAGAEMGKLVAARYPLDEVDEEDDGDEASETENGSEEARDPDFLFRELRALRLDVDRLLAAGEVEEAEGLMEEKRQYLAGQGYFIRKINQAYFAFHGLYGTSGAASSPIGPKLGDLRARVPSLGEYIRVVADVTSESDLDRLLAEYGAPTPP